MVWFKTLIFTVIVPGAIIGLIPYLLLSRNPASFADIGRIQLLGPIPMTLLGGAWLFSSWALVIYAAIVITWQHLFVVYYEEPALKRKFGESYSNYLARTPRWIPRFSNSGE
jgi:hypothetical protein